MKRKLALAAAVLALFAVTVAPSAHAQTLTTRTDQASYAPGGSGTLFITIVNESGSNTVEIRNLTIYFPWAGFVDGKWDSSNNVTNNLSPYKVLATAGSPGGGNIFSWSTTFSIPSWFSGLNTGPGCPGNTTVRYGLYSNCILLGSNQNTFRYESFDIAISMAQPVYEASSLTTLILPIVEVVVLVIAVGLLFMVWSSLKRMEPARKTT